MTKDVIKGLGELLQMVAPTLEGIYDVSVRIGGRTPATLPRAGSIPRTGRRPAADAAREPVVDLFDEGDHLVVIAQLPGAERHAWSFPDPSHLSIRGDATDRKYAKDLPLPHAVEEQATESSFANGVLELKLWKRG